LAVQSKVSLYRNSDSNSEVKKSENDTQTD
jgi:hypothetical protein